MMKAICCGMSHGNVKILRILYMLDMQCCSVVVSCQLTMVSVLTLKRGGDWCSIGK